MGDYRKIKPEEKAQLYKKFRMVGGKIVEVQPRESKQAQDKINNYVDAKEYEQQVAEKEKDIIRKKRLAAMKLAEEKERREREMSARLGSNQTEPEEGDRQASGESKKSGVAPVRTKHELSREDAVKSFAAFWARLKCVFNGVLKTFDDKFTRGFFHMTLSDLYRVLSRIQSIFVSALHQDPLVTQAIESKLEKIGRPYYFELVWRLDRILEPALFGSIDELRTWKSQIKQGKYPFRELFKKLYALKKYVPVLKHAVDNLLAAEAQIRNLKMDIVKANLKFLEKNIDYAFDVYYPKILLLMEFYYKIRLFFNPRETFEGFLNYEKSDIVGYYTQLWREQREYEERKKNLEEALKRDEQVENKKKPLIDRIKENDSLADAVKEGLQAIYDEVDFERMKNALVESKDPISILDINDKVFLIFTLIESFYRQYSFLYLSGQVRYNVFFDKNGSRVDLKNTMKDLYYRMNSIYQRIREYTKIISEVRKFEAGFTVKVNEDIPEMKNLLNHRIDLLRIINYETRQRMEQYSKVFYYIVRDYVGKNEILQNGGDFLDLKIPDKDGSVKPQKRIFQMFREGYNFTMAFYFLLTDGDLNTADFLVKEPEYIKLPLPSEEGETQTVKADEGDGEGGLKLNAPDLPQENEPAPPDENKPKEQNGD